MVPCGDSETIVPWKDLPRKDEEYETNGGNVELTRVFFEVKRIRLRARSTFNTYGSENEITVFHALTLSLLPSLNRFSQAMSCVPKAFLLSVGSASALCSIEIQPVIPSARRTTIPLSEIRCTVPSRIDPISTSSILKNGWSRTRCSKDNWNRLSTGL